MSLRTVDCLVIVEIQINALLLIDVIYDFHFDTFQSRMLQETDLFYSFKAKTITNILQIG